NKRVQIISAIVRDDRHAQIARDFGADNVIIVTKDNTALLEDASLNSKFDVVFDTTGTPDGLRHALTLAKREIHLKSTHGQQVFGLRHLTEMVVAELALVPLDSLGLSNGLEFSWTTGKNKNNKNVFCSSTVPVSVTRAVEATGRFVHTQLSVDAADAAFQTGALEQKLLATGSPFPRFDLAIVTSLSEIDALIQPSPKHDRSLIRPRGAILLLQNETESTSHDTHSRLLVSKKIKISTSRCGDFHNALEVMMQKDSEGKLLGNRLEKLVTHRYLLKDLPHAFDVARGT
ncbi:hypothetical protein HDU99_005271, partial [Rhizoclosmatium hyalinum]